MKPAKRNSLLIIFLFIPIIAFWGCEQESLDETTAVKIYVEKMIAEERYLTKPDSLEIFKRKVYEKYKISKTEYDEYLKGIKGDSEKWASFFKEADKYLTELKNQNVVN